jgi:hypothetical protein
LRRRLLRHGRGGRGGPPDSCNFGQNSHEFHNQEQARTSPCFHQVFDSQVKTLGKKVVPKKDSN